MAGGRKPFKELLRLYRVKDGYLLPLGLFVIFLSRTLRAFCNILFFRDLSRHVRCPRVLKHGFILLRKLSLWLGALSRSP